MVAWSDDPFFTSCRRPDTWTKDGTRRQCGKKTSRWRSCDDLGNVLLGNPESRHPCGYQFDPCHLPKHHYGQAPHVERLIDEYIKNSLRFVKVENIIVFNKDIAKATNKKEAQESYLKAYEPHLKGVCIALDVLDRKSVV